ncbi:hypothetical protein ACQEVB_09350 [Pseudonocardia sp. CA-107938]|uniref:hypothetical protein n=1 Tax=Pseudonocardia sp. CA-107938 TaxID=3240021 RepID=UPI003D8BDDDF
MLVNGIARRRRRRWHGELPWARPPEARAGAGPEEAVVNRTAVAAALDRLATDPALAEEFR